MLLYRNLHKLYWLHRYLERSYALSQLISSFSRGMLEWKEVQQLQYTFILELMGESELAKQIASEQPDASLQFLLCDKDFAHSLENCLAQMHKNAREVRDLIPTEAWNILNFLSIHAQSAKTINHQSIQSYCQTIQTAYFQYIGCLSLSLSHNEIRNFCDLGLFMERADKTSRCLDLKWILQNQLESRDQRQGGLWQMLLDSLLAIDMYRKEHGIIQSPDVLRFLLMNQNFPRSVYHCVEAMEDTLKAIWKHQGQSAPSLSLRKLRATKTWLIAEAGSDFIESHLHDALDELQYLLNRLDDTLHEEFFIIESPLIRKSDTIARTHLALELGQLQD